MFEKPFMFDKDYLVVQYVANPVKMLSFFMLGMRLTFKKACLVEEHMSNCCHNRKNWNWLVFQFDLVRCGIIAGM